MFFCRSCQLPRLGGASLSRSSLSFQSPAKGREGAIRISNNLEWQEWEMETSRVESGTRERFSDLQALHQDQVVVVIIIEAQLGKGPWRFSSPTPLPKAEIFIQSKKIQHWVLHHRRFSKLDWTAICSPWNKAPAFGKGPMWKEEGREEERREGRREGNRWSEGEGRKEEKEGRREGGKGEERRERGGRAMDRTTSLPLPSFLPPEKEGRKGRKEGRMGNRWSEGEGRKEEKKEGRRERREGNG
ncbi:Octapeptide-repeat protein T2, partial [Ophiophagus hannah]